MNNRLKCILSHIDDGLGVIDVGTDHAYLPIALAQRGYKGNIIASDLNEIPLNKGRLNAAANNLDGYIDFRLSDGLMSCSAEEVDTIVIAGMGGDTICGILDRAEWCMDSRYKLILQPMTKAEILRYWLCNNGFLITTEERIKENGNIYQILTAVYKDNMQLTDAELFMGKYDLVRDKELFVQELDKCILRFEAAVSGMSAAANENALCVLYAGILTELKEMREKYVHGK